MCSHVPLCGRHISLNGILITRFIVPEGVTRRDRPIQVQNWPLWAHPPIGPRGLLWPIELRPPSCLVIEAEEVRCAGVAARGVRPPFSGGTALVGLAVFLYGVPLFGGVGQSVLNQSKLRLT